MKKAVFHQAQKKLFFILCLALHFHISNAQEFYLGGVQINEPSHEHWVNRLKNIGMNTVSVTVYARHARWDSGYIWWNEQEPYVVKEIIEAKKAGMKVVLIPRIALDHYFEENEFLWHGMIMPKSDNLLNYFFENYTIFVSHWAKIAKKHQVDIFAIGSELRALAETKPIDEIPMLEDFYLDSTRQKEYLEERLAFQQEIEEWAERHEQPYTSLKSSLEREMAKTQKWARTNTFNHTTNPIENMNTAREKRLAHWYKLIANIRKVYSGKLTYAANFDNYQNIKFWDKLDFIGINAYFSLRDYKTHISEREKFREMKGGWRWIFSEIERFRTQEELSQKVLFTELGYTCYESNGVMPWMGFGFSISKNVKTQQKELLIWPEQKKNTRERASAVKALYMVNKKYHLLQGILYWKLTTKHYHLPYEPFGLHIRRFAKDPLQRSLEKFRKAY